MIGSYYCFDNPAALAVYLKKSHTGKKTMELSSLQYNLLYSVYSFPNIILPFFGGIMVDKMGVRIGVFLFTFILIIG